MFVSPSPTPCGGSDLLLEETDTLLSYFNDSSPDYETFCFDIEETSSGSTTSHSDFSLPDYESGEKTRAMETPSFSSHHMPSSRPAAYLPKEVMIPFNLEALCACFQSSNHAVSDHLHVLILMLWDNIFTPKKFLESLDLTGKKEHYVIRMFWEILKNSSLEDRQKFFKWEIGIGDGLGVVRTVNNLANGGDSATSGLTPQAMEHGMQSLIMDGRDSKVARGSSLFGSSAIEYEGASSSFEKERKPFTNFNACFSRGSLANDAYQRTEDLKSLKEVFHSKINLMETKDHHDLEKSKANRWEKYDAKGWCEKGAHKYGRLNEQPYKGKVG
ncbi:hypothetical protein Tco_1569563 [Tanacetum coccineum]